MIPKAVDRTSLQSQLKVVLYRPCLYNRLFIDFPFSSSYPHQFPKNLHFLFSSLCVQSMSGLNATQTQTCRQIIHLSFGRETSGCTPPSPGHIFVLRLIIGYLFVCILGPLLSCLGRLALMEWECSPVDSAIGLPKKKKKKTVVGVVGE